jgi:histidinol-phosphate aminotransferase
MDRLRPPFNVSGPGEAAAVAALADRDFTERTLAHVRRWRPLYAQRLAALGLQPVDSATNFVTFRVPTGAAALEQALAERGVLVRGLSNYGLPEHLRITIGSDEDSERVFGLLDQIIRRDG